MPSPLPPSFRRYDYGTYGSDLYGGIIWTFPVKDAGAAVSTPTPPAEAVADSDVPESGDAQ